MATLVLSTVGTVLGGPVGGAIGSLLGQSIDQQMFGPGPRHGPRLGDLSVQSSAYGTPVPRLFGTIRVAGSIVWSTDLKEDSQTQGAKGQPDSVTYSYSISFAVALSSRIVGRIKRIWADGKLLRGAAGDFKVSTVFRFYPGAEDQPVDPLIGSVEGVGSTPAYRGMALAVFENLQLAEYGNRIPFLTFEVEADAVPPTLGEILLEASDGVIQSTAAAQLHGYAAHGGTVDAAIAPLVEHFGIALFDDGERLRAPGSATFDLGDDEVGSQVGLEPAPRIQRTQAAARSLPSVLTLGYYDPDRDYQTAQMRASTGSPATIVAVEQLAAVMNSATARALAESSLARRWAQRDRLTLRLPPAHLGLEPGMTVRPPGEAHGWTAFRVSVDGLAVVAELQPEVGAVDSLPADPGRSLPAKDIVATPTTMAMVELPESGSTKPDSPMVVLAAAAASGGARRVPVDVIVGGSLRAIASAPRQAVLGRAITALAVGQPALIDLESSVEVELADPDQWLLSCGDDALAAGHNLAMVGRELVQFGAAAAIGPGRFRLSRLLRGRRGTEWAMAGHQPGDIFLLLDVQSLERVDVSYEQVGATISATARGIADTGAPPVELAVSGEALRPPSPVHVSATIDAAGDLQCSWCRRSRLGWAWADGVDAPLGAASELYRITLEAGSLAIETETVVPQVTFTAAQLAGLGQGPFTLSVAQVGELALSRPATITISQD